MSWQSGRQNGGVTRWHPVALISCANCNQIVTIGISRESRRRPRRRIESPAAPGVDALPPRRHGPRIAPRHGLAYGLPIASGAFGGLSPGQRLPASPTTAYRGGRGQGLRLPHVRTRHGPRPATAPGRLHRRGHRRGPAPLDAATVPATVSTAPPKATAPRCPASDHPGDLAPRVPHSGFPALGTPCRPGSTCCRLSRRRDLPAVPPGSAAPGRATDHAPRARTCRTWKRCRRPRRLTPRRLTPRCVPTAPGARRPRPRPGHVLDGHGSTPGPARRAARKRHALDGQRTRAQ